jgi:hypothetical protein
LSQILALKPMTEAMKKPEGDFRDWEAIRACANGCAWRFCDPQP